METAVCRREISSDSFPLYEDIDGEYYYGYRTTITYDEKGRTVYKYRPLTPEDLLEPEEGDVYMEGSLHEKDLDRLKSIFRHALKDRKNVTVYSDLKIQWGVDGLSNPAPDISIFENVKDPEKPRNSFFVQEEGVKPFFVLEVVSPRYRDTDTDGKPGIYRKARVPEYIIVDPGLEGNKISYTVSGHRLAGNRYVKIKPDRQGRILSLTTGLFIGVSELRDRLIVTDVQTGEEILSDDERAEEAEIRAEQEAIRAEQEATRAEQEKIRAEKEKIRADSAEEELRELKEKLKARGIPT